MAQPLYLTVDELPAYSYNPNATNSFSLDAKRAAIRSASATIDSYLRSKYELPLVQFGEDIKQACAAIAAYRLLVQRGFNPQAPGDANARQVYDDSIAWLNAIASNTGPTPDVTDSSSGATEGGQDSPIVITGTQRGWSTRGVYPKPAGDFEGD